MHPVAALLTLICFGLSVAAHFHSPAHSPRYLLALLIFTIPTVLVSLLAFLVDILIFVPHVSWGGWIVLAATILIIASMVLTCAMRRTLVSRKARKKRIAENAEMSGENYYHQRAAVDMNMVNTPLGPPSTIGTMSEFPKAESPPPMPTISPNSETAGDFASFDIEKKMSGDERMPLSGNGAAPGRGRSSSGGWRGPGMGPMNDPYGPPMGRSRDPYGPGAPPNPAMGPGMGMMAAGMGAGLRRQSSDNSMGSRGSSTRGGPPPFYGRGRGGYPQRGGYPPRGAPYGRGSMRGGPMGYGGPGRGGPMGYGGPGRGGPMMGRGGMRGPPPPNYYGGPPSNPPGPRGPYDGSTYVGSQQQDVSPPGSREQNLDAPPGAIGQAVEMDGRNGVPSPTRQNFGLRDSDADVQGMIGMQQQRRSDATDPMSPTSVYSEQ